MTAATIPGLEKAPTTHKGLLAWVQEVAELTQPDRVVFADGSAAVGGALMMIGLDMTRLLHDIVTAGVAAGLLRPDLHSDRAVLLIGQQKYSVPIARMAEGVGLARSVRARMSEVGGRVEVRSAPGEGAEVCLWLG